LRALQDRLRGVPQPDGSRSAEQERRIRLAYLDGAESWSRETAGRGLTGGELEGVIRRYREGDPPRRPVRGNGARPDIGWGENSRLLPGTASGSAAAPTLGDLVH